MSKQLEFYTRDINGNKRVLDSKEIYVGFSHDETLRISIENNVIKPRLTIMNYSNVPTNSGGHLLMGAWASNVLAITIEMVLRSCQTTALATALQFYTQNKAGDKIICDYKKLYVKFSSHEDLSIEICSYGERPTELIFRSFNGPEYGGSDDGAKGTCLVATFHASNVVSIDIMTPINN